MGGSYWRNCSRTITRMWLFILVTCVAILAIFFIISLGNIRKLRDEWPAYRCNPFYMPLAYFVMDPGGFDGVGQNFESCMAMMSTDITGTMTDALGSQFSMIGEFLEGLTNPLALFRQMFMMMRNFIYGFTTSTLGKISTPLSTFVYYLNKIQDLVRRMVGEGYIAVFFGVTAVSFIEGFISLVRKIIEGFILFMLGLSIVLALFQPEILAIVLVLASSLAAAGG